MLALVAVSVASIVSISCRIVAGAVLEKRGTIPSHMSVACVVLLL